MLSQVFYKLGRPMVNLYAGLMFDMDVTWEEPLPKGPKIIAPNHPSTTDPFLIAGLVAEPTSILIDDRLFKVPVFGRYLHLAGHVPVVDGNGRQAFDAAKRLLFHRSEVFEPECFGISPREAVNIDPQHRLLPGLAQGLLPLRSVQELPGHLQVAVADSLVMFLPGRIAPAGQP